MERPFLLFKRLAPRAWCADLGATAPYRVPARFVGAPYRALAADLLAQGVVPLGLFRSAGSVGGAALPFAVMVGPRDARELVGSDFLYVIASHDWVRDHARHDWVLP